MEASRTSSGRRWAAESPSGTKFGSPLARASFVRRFRPRMFARTLLLEKSDQSAACSAGDLKHCNEAESNSYGLKARNLNGFRALMRVLCRYWLVVNRTAEMPS